jgi:hypothetical protein
MFLHIMVGQNPKNQMLKKLQFLILYDVMLGYMFAKTFMSKHILNENIFKK